MRLTLPDDGPPGWVELSRDVHPDGSATLRHSSLSPSAGPAYDEAQGDRNLGTAPSIWSAMSCGPWVCPRLQNLITRTSSFGFVCESSLMGVVEQKKPFGPRPTISDAAERPRQLGACVLQLETTLLLTQDFRRRMKMESIDQIVTVRQGETRVDPICELGTTGSAKPPDRLPVVLLLLCFSGLERRHLLLRIFGSSLFLVEP